MNITGIDLASAGRALPAQKTDKAQGSGFGDLLSQAVASVNRQAQDSAALSEGLVTGQHSNIHETMIAMEESGISFRMLAKVESKVIDAYKEVMRLQL